jgi:chromate transporter
LRHAKALIYGRPANDAKLTHSKTPGRRTEAKSRVFVTTLENDMAAPTLRTLAAVFVRHGNLTFGGGSATVATLHREIIERRGWLEQHRFNLAFALSRLTPGTNLLAFSTAIGWMLRRWSGAVVTLLAGSLPCAALAVGVTAFYELWSRNATAQIALRGALAAAVGVMVITGVTIIRPQWRGASWVRLLMFVGGAFAWSLVFSIPPIRILLVAAAVGGLWPVEEKKA